MTADTNPAIDDELNTTAPQDKPAAWKMPEPVFRRTSGRLPKGFEQQFAPTGEHDNSAPSPGSVQAYVEPKPKSPTMKIVVVALAIVAMVAFLIAFLSLLYFFFLRSSD